MCRAAFRLFAAASLALFAAERAAAQAGGVTVAVFPFENAGAYGEDRTAVEARRVAIAAMFATELGARPGIRTVDPREAGRALGGLPQRVDAATAARAARQLGARYAVTGSFVDHFGRFRLNAQLVDARSGAIVRVFSNDDPALQRRDHLPRMVQAQAERIATELSSEQ